MGTETYLDLRARPGQLLVTFGPQGPCQEQRGTFSRAAAGGHRAVQAGARRSAAVSRAEEGLHALPWGPFSFETVCGKGRRGRVQRLKTPSHFSSLLFTSAPL